VAFTTLAAAANWFEPSLKPLSFWPCVIPAAFVLAASIRIGRRRSGCCCGHHGWRKNCLGRTKKIEKFFWILPTASNAPRSRSLFRNLRTRHRRPRDADLRVRIPEAPIATHGSPFRSRMALLRAADG
tara:strand:- start:2656 stop:3039 length:384 start_codon:yes stop_codon:yes gene_type:complete